MITLVTGLWDIGRDNLLEGWSRSFSYYKEKLKELLNTDNNIIIFGDEEIRQLVVQSGKQNIQFIFRTTDWFKNEFYDKIQEIRQDPDWYNQVGWLKESTQAKLQMYNPLVMSKMFLLHDAKLLDKFNSEYLFWIDAGITNTVHPGYFTKDKVFEKLPKYLNKFHFVCFPYETNSEIHGFKINDMNRYSNDDVNMVARGGFFGGRKEIIGEINTLYYNLLKSSLNENLMGTEESIFTIMTYLYPNLISYSLIESNGLMGTFFENI
jgi:hypothetical protein